MEIMKLFLVSLLLLQISACSTLKTNKSIYVSREMEKNLKFNAKLFDLLLFDNDKLVNKISRKCLTDSFAGEVEKLLDTLKAQRLAIFYIEIGVCYQLAGEFTKAFYYYDQGVSKLKKHEKQLKSLVFNNLGVMYGKRDQFDKSYAYLEKSLIELPNNFNTIYNMSLLLTSVGRYSESISLIQKFRGDKDEELQLMKILGINYLSVNDFGSLESKVINRLDDSLDEKTILRALVKFQRTGDSKVVFEMIEDLDDLNPYYQQVFKEFVRLLKQRIREDESRKAHISFSKSGGIKNS